MPWVFSQGTNEQCRLFFFAGFGQLILETGRGPKHDEQRVTVAIYFDADFDQQSFKSASGLVV